MSVKTYRVLEEYLFEVEGLEFMVKGRISYSDELPESVGGYYWEISHFWGGGSGHHTYYPSIRTGKTIEEARQHLFGYAKSFVADGVKAATSY